MSNIFKLDAKSSPLLSTNEFKDSLTQIIKNAEREIVVYSGFIKMAGITWLRDLINNHVKCTIITRWNKMDIIQKASDLEVYEICNEYGWIFKTDQNCHAKVILIDNKFLALGSANLTPSGLGLIPISNKEAGIIKEKNSDDDKSFNELINSSHTITNDEYLKIKKWYEKNKIDKKILKIPSMPVKFTPDTIINSENLWVNNFPFLSFQEFSSYKSNDEIFQHELDLLCIEEFNYDAIKDEFKNIHIYVWLRNILKSHDKGLYFGEMKDVIRKSLLDDERIYSKTLTILLSNLYSYIKEFDYGDFRITRPNYSELIELL
mgnify:CR=1 FL=1